MPIIAQIMVQNIKKTVAESVLYPSLLFHVIVLPPVFALSGNLLFTSSLKKLNISTFFCF
jgi:hypothetical protein